MDRSAALREYFGVRSRDLMPCEVHMRLLAWIMQMQILLYSGPNVTLFGVSGSSVWSHGQGQTQTGHGRGAR